MEHIAADVERGAADNVLDVVVVLTLRSRRTHQAALRPGTRLSARLTHRDKQASRAQDSERQKICREFIARDRAIPPFSPRADVTLVTFQVRVRNHAKMVDCYLTTYYNHKTFFGDKRQISDKIIENPQDYHIYEGLSTLTNISRYDLPDPDVYRDFFRLNPLYDFPLLSSTCTYFRGCPINRLDVAIAYDLPELVGKYKKSVEAVLHEKEANSPAS